MGALGVLTATSSLDHRCEWVKAPIRMGVPTAVMEASGGAPDISGGGTMTLELALFAGSAAAAIFVIGQLPMLIKARRTRDLSPYSLTNINWHTGHVHQPKRSAPNPQGAQNLNREPARR